MNKPNHILCPVILFDDSTQCDNIGRLKAQPVLCSIGNICGKIRRSADAWFLLGMIPPYPKTSDEKSKEPHTVHLKYYHECLSQILSEFKELHDREEGVEMNVHKLGNVTVHFELSFIIGDTKGHEDMCCHYNAQSSDLPRMLRDCDVPTSRGDDPDYDCQFNLKSDIEEIVMEGIRQGDADTSNSISQHLARPIYWDFRFGNDPHGIHGSLPYEILHLFYLGLLKYLLTSLFNFVHVPSRVKRWYTERKSGTERDKPDIPDNVKKRCKFAKAEFERRFRVCRFAASRQSDRNVPRTNFNHGVSKLTRLTGQEYNGLCLLSMVVLEGLLGTTDARRRMERKYVLLMWLSLSLEVWLTKDEYTEGELEELEEKINKYLKLFRDVVGPQREVMSKCGLRISKFHGLKHIPFYIRRFGSANNFFGGHLEAALKVVVKQQTARTSRQHHRFLLDLMNRYHEEKVVGISQRVLFQRGEWSFGKSSTRVTSTGEYNYDYRLPQVKFFLEKVEGIWVTTIGRKRYPRAFHPDRNDVVGNDWVMKLCQKADENGFDMISCHYACQVPTSEKQSHDMFRCDPDYHSYPWKKRSWHDWAMIRWSLDDNDDDIGQGDDAHYYVTAGKLLLWGLLSKKDGDETELNCVVQSLKSEHPSPHGYLFFANGDEIEDTFRVVKFQNIESVAFVLPGVPPPNTNLRNNQDWFSDNPDDHKYFVLFPPRSKWGDIGWDRV